MKRARMNRYRAFAALLALLVLGTLARAQEAEPTLASELARAREAWLLADDSHAESRVDALGADSRIKGDLGRWVTGFSAALKLKRGDVQGAQRVLRAMLQRARDARAYFRAARLLLAFDQGPIALELAREGRARHADSRALARLEADLLWVKGEHDAAITAYSALIASVPSARYPYESAPVLYWEQVEPWPESGETKSEPAPDEEDGWRRGRALPQGKDEPHCSLCLSPVWYTTDLPGFERTVMECARDDKRAGLARARLDALLVEVAAALEAVDRSRGGIEERAALERALREVRARALAEVRIASLCEIGNGRGAEAEILARKGLAASRSDVGLLDVLAQALALQGKAEEARRFPLEDLNRNAQLVIPQGPSGVLGAPLRYERVFAGARQLYKANPLAGKAQFEAMRTAYGQGEQTTAVEPGNLGLWLLLKGDTELARSYLEVASQLHKTDESMSLAPAWELPLLSLQTEELKSAKADPAGGANPWLALAQRAGLVRGHNLEINAYITGLGNPGMYFGYRNQGLPQFAMASKQGQDFLPVLLHELPSLLAARCSQEELDAVLGESSAESRQLRTTLDQFATLIDECLANRQNWEAREKAGQRAVPVLCAFEARALLIQARFAQSRPNTLAGLNGWLAKYQPILDPRKSFKSVPLTDDDVREAEQRNKRGVPEVFHSGLLLDCALALARNGAFEAAGDLLLLNPRPWLDGVNAQRRMMLAALFFKKAGKPHEELKARMALASTGDGQYSGFVKAEFERERAEILEFGQRSDLLEFITLRYVPGLRGDAIDQFIALCPEIREADSTLWFRNTPQDGAALLYANSFGNGSLSAIYENWPKILMTGEPMLTPWRLAIWCLVSDFMIGRVWDDYGMASTGDCLRIWRMLAKTLALGGDSTKGSAELLSRLEQRCGGNVQASPEGDDYPEEE
jgi:hypothetical protein